MTCPRCGVVRPVLRQQIRRQQRQGKFTGLCFPCSKVGLRRADVGAWVESLEWAQLELAPEAGGRQRSRFVIYCPRCGERRTVSRSQARVEMKAGRFTLLCVGCRLEDPAAP